MLVAYRSLNDSLAWLDISLWCICIFISLLFMFLTMFKITIDNGGATELQRRNAFTWAVAFMLLGIANILNLIWRYTIEDAFFVTIIDGMSVLCVNLAFFLKIVHTEYTINRYEFYKGYFFSIAALALIIFTSIVTPEAIRAIGIYQSIYIILLAFGGSIFPMIFLYLAIKLQGKERQMAVIMLIGALLFMVGFLGEPHNIKPIMIYYNFPNVDLWVSIFLILSPILVLIAMIIIFSSYYSGI